MAVTQGILEVALAAADAHGASRVLAVDLVIGDFAGLVDDSVQFYFDILSRDTAAEGAVLRIRREPARAACLDCGHTFVTRAPLPSACPACGGPRLRVRQERELYVESIEVDDEDSRRPEHSERK